MLDAKVSRVASRPGFEQASYVIDLLDDCTPQGTSLEHEDVSFVGKVSSRFVRPWT